MFFFYNLLINLFYPLFIILIYIRKFFNKEDKVKFTEKIYKSYNFLSLNDKKKLYWFHGASLGEVSSAIPIIEFLSKKKNVNILITSLTLSSGKLIQKRFSKVQNISHQYLPYDKKDLINHFLNYWSPNFVIFIDSEVWPNFFKEINFRKIPLVLLNGRISDKATNRWLILKSFSSKIFSYIDLCLAANNSSKKNLKQLGVKNIKYIGNLKFFSKKNKTENLKSFTVKSIKKRMVWCAASTHSGEEQICLEIHKTLLNKFNNLLLVIIPRHLNRVNEITSICQNLNLKFQIFSENDEKIIKRDTKVLVVNTFGQLQKYFNYCKKVFIGKSLLQKFNNSGGQNPLEAVYCGCKVYHGPYISNFDEIYKYLNLKKISAEVKDSQELLKKLSLDFNNKRSKNNKRYKKIENYGTKILNSSIKEILKLEK